MHLVDNFTCECGQVYANKANLKRHKTKAHKGRVSVQGVESLWGDCGFIPADWGS